jgi:tetratricopeptide (TPR) repeat protein
LHTAVTSLLLLFAVFPFAAANVETPPADCAQILTWMASGVPQQRIARLARAHGVEDVVMRDLSRAGASPELLAAVRDSAVEPRGKSLVGCPTSFLEMAIASRQQKFGTAEELARKLIFLHPDNAELRMVMGYLRRRQDDMDEAFDAYSEAKELDPNLPEVHNGLAFIFFRSNDAEDTIGEARTSLSMDPQNAEAHRLLGMGLYLDEKYEAALNAFDEALVRDPMDAEAYFGMGLTQRALGELGAAARAFRRSVQLDPDFGDAARELELVLIEIDRKSQASAARAGVDPVPIDLAIHPLW